MPRERRSKYANDAKDTAQLASSLAQKATIPYVDTKVAAVASGSPKAVYATLSALQTAFPTGNTNIYLVTADGKWYYWNSSAWTAGGTYQSSGIANDGVTPPLLLKGDHLVPTLVDILNRNTLSVGYKNATGVAQAGSAWRYSDFIAVTAGKQYELFLKDSVGGTSFTFEGTYYDSSHTALGAIQFQQMPYTWTAPANTAYVTVNFGGNYVNEVYFKETQILPAKYNVNWLNVKLANLDSEVDQHIETTVNDAVSSFAFVNRWKGKKANFLGDSITYGAGLTSRDTERFSALVKTGLELTTENNYGVSGTRLANNVTNSGADDTNAMSIRYTSMTNDADIVFVCAGTNDYGSAFSITGAHTAPFGAFTDRANSTFYGALHVLYKGLIEKYFGKTIIIITPPHRAGIGDSSSNDLSLNPVTNKNLRDYVNAIREVAEFYGLYVLDLYKELNINPNITLNKTTYMPDTLHPNAAGHQLIANAIINFTKRL
jgi:lysophospholipase L1-like esterase